MQNMYVTTGICLLLVTVWMYWSWKNRRYRNFPPGPFQWPIVGNLLQTGRAPHLVLAKLTKQYGPVVGVQMGPNKTVFIHGATLIREAFSSPKLCGKFKREAGIFLSGEGAGIFHTEGEVWTEQRRFVLRTLREFGFGKTGMEELVLDNVSNLSKWIRKQNGQTVDILPQLRLSILNAIWEIITGQRFHHEDSELLNLLSELERTANTLVNSDSLKGAIIFHYPKIAQMFPNWSGWNRLDKERKPREKIFEKIIQQHLDTFVKGQQRDFIDAYLEEISQTTNQNSTFHPDVGYNSLKSVVTELFLAGNDTTAVSCCWALLHLYYYPDVQTKMQAELDRVIGRHQNPTLRDRKSLPYAEAVIIESMRLASITPVNLVHQSTEDVQFNGYDIPKGTHIFANLWHSHQDPEVWGDPKVFRPERFLSPDGTQVIKHEAFLPFSTGVRMCPGKKFATDSLFLFVTNLVHTFDICPPDNPELISLEVNFRGVTLAPLLSMISFKDRVAKDSLLTSTRLPNCNQG